MKESRRRREKSVEQKCVGESRPLHGMPDVLGPWRLMMSQAARGSNPRDLRQGKKGKKRSVKQLRRTKPFLQGRKYNVRRDRRCREDSSSGPQVRRIVAKHDWPKIITRLQRLIFEVGALGLRARTLRLRIQMDLTPAAWVNI